MRVPTLSALVLAAACGGIRAPAPVHPSWEPLFGIYEFTGSAVGHSPLSVVGTLRLDAEGYRLGSSNGSCHDRLERPWVGPEFGAACDGIRVVFRQVDGGVAEEGKAIVTVQELREREECRTNANGQVVCHTVEDIVTVQREVRLQVRRLGTGVS